MESNVADAPPLSPADEPTAASGPTVGSTTENRQYVTFHIDDGIFAVPLAEVQEIIRMPDIIQVPLSHASLEGLANLRGTVMSVTSLRRIFRYPDVEHDDATRVVVLNRGIPVGLVVDRMSAVVTAEPDRIESVSSIEATVNTDLLLGMIKPADGKGMIMILDPVRLFESDSTGERRRAQKLGPAEIETALEQAVETTDEMQLVSFEVAGQEYALTIENVQEIVQLPEHINRVPKSDAHVLGVVTLRDRLLPLVSLREMFGLPAVPLDDRSKIVVVPLPDRTSVGIVMDTVKEVLRVHKSVLDPVPSLMRGGKSRGEIQGICRLSGGQRLVAVLSADALFDNEVVRHAAARLSTAENEENLMALSDVGGALALAEEEQFVVFRLADEEYGVPIDAVQEIVRVPDSLTRLPKAPNFIKGVVNLRGAVLPVVDQRTRFGLDDVERNDRQRIMVFTIDGVRTGFIVDSVSEVLKIPRSAIGPTPLLSEEQTRIISRVANLEKQKRVILLIDTDHLLEKHELAKLEEASSVTTQRVPASEPSPALCPSF